MIEEGIGWDERIVMDNDGDIMVIVVI